MQLGRVNGLTGVKKHRYTINPRYHGNRALAMMCQRPSWIETAIWLRARGVCLATMVLAGTRELVT